MDPLPVSSSNDDDVEWVTIVSHPQYQINEQHQVRNTHTKRILKVSKSGTVALRLNGKTSDVSLNQIYLRTFQRLQEGEIWKEHPEYPSIEISNHGHVLRKSIKSITKGDVGQDGRCQIKVKNKDGQMKYLSVHLLVADLFLPPSPGVEYRIKHKDGDLSINHASNLEWQLPPSKKKKEPISIKVSIYQLDMNNNIIKEYESMNEAARVLNIPAASISKCCRGERQTTHGWKFSYVSVPDEKKK